MNPGKMFTDACEAGAALFSRESREVYTTGIAHSFALPFAVAFAVSKDLRERFTAKGRQEAAMMRWSTAKHEVGHAFPVALLGGEDEPITKIVARSTSRSACGLYMLLSSLPVIGGRIDPTQTTPGSAPYGGSFHARYLDVIGHLGGFAAESDLGTRYMRKKVREDLELTARSSLFFHSDTSVPFHYVKSRIHFLGLDEESIPTKPNNEDVVAVCMNVFEQLQSVFGSEQFRNALAVLQYWVHGKQVVEADDLRPEIFRLVTGESGLEKAEDHTDLQQMKEELETIDIDALIREHFVS